jgi:hypothetical protein
MTTMEPSKQSMEALEKTFTGTWQTKLVRFFPCGPFWKAIACPCICESQRHKNPLILFPKTDSLVQSTVSPPSASATQQ